MKIVLVHLSQNSFLSSVCISESILKTKTQISIQYFRSKATFLKVVQFQLRICSKCWLMRRKRRLARCARTSFGQDAILLLRRLSFQFVTVFICPIRMQLFINAIAFNLQWHLYNSKPHNNLVDCFVFVVCTGIAIRLCLQFFFLIV